LLISIRSSIKQKIYWPDARSPFQYLSVPTSKELLSLVYRIDAQNRVSKVNEAWIKFARENNGEGALPEKVLGSDIITAISDHTIKELYVSMIRQARNGHQVKFQYRCDAPEKRRLFSMHITKTLVGEVEFVSTMVNEELRESVKFLEPDQPRSNVHLRVCSWCQKVALPPDNWVPVEEAVEKTGMMEATQLPAITHGICPSCYEEMLGSLDEPT